MAQAIQPDTRSSFLAQLLSPIAAPAERRSFLAELRKEAEIAWSIAYHRLYAARAFEEHCSHQRRIAELEGRTLKVPREDAALDNAHLAHISAVDRMMMTPAPTLGALRQKRRMRTMSGGRDRWEAAIAADAARLEEKA